MKAKDKVKNLLTKYPHFRDSDNKLIAAYWFEELKRKGMNPNEMSGMDFLHYFADSKLTNSETIHRCRRKAQEQNKELRGKNYEVRQDKMQKQWRKDLGYDNK
tara:strand:+ start:421 stop:729 length:309 start_codon:yes stop_codon:yes gene_type:complete